MKKVTAENGRLLYRNPLYRSYSPRLNQNYSSVVAMVRQKGCGKETQSYHQVKTRNIGFQNRESIKGIDCSSAKKVVTHCERASFSQQPERKFPSKFKKSKLHCPKNSQSEQEKYSNSVSELEQERVLILPRRFSESGKVEPT